MLWTFQVKWIKRVGIGSSVRWLSRPRSYRLKKPVWLALGDTVGNLDGGWELPTAEGARSSLIRREMLNDGMATMGTAANGWVLASSTSLVSGTRNVVW